MSFILLFFSTVVLKSASKVWIASLFSLRFLFFFLSFQDVVWICSFSRRRKKKTKRKKRTERKKKKKRRVFLLVSEGGE